MRAIAAAGALWLGACDPAPPDVKIRTGMDPEELNELPSFHQVKAAIVHDVRRDRMLQLKLSDGRPERPPGIVDEDDALLCAADRSPLEVYSIRSDPQDQPYRVDEWAVFCRHEFTYFYRYVGGPKRLDVWLGPFKLERRYPRIEDRVEK